MDKSRIGPFALEDRLGDSPHGSVFRALHLQQRRFVALKLFPAPLLMNSPPAKGALVREIETLKRLQHPNIARCFGGLLEDSQIGLVCELVEGESLRSLLTRRGRLSWEAVVEYSMQISAALEHAHEAGVHHLDLVPDKILISAADQIKIVDFRCERMINPTCVSSQRRTPDRVRYQSPEQVRGDTKLTHKSDLYSLGCLMFEMLVGRPVFPGETLAEIEQQRHERVPRVDAVVFDCPVWLDSLVGQLLDSDLVRRPYSARAVSDALRETHRKVAAQTSVLEHAAGGFSSIKRTADQQIARDLLKNARREVLQQRNAGEELPPFWERPWFLSACLFALLGLVGTYLLWPVSEETLIHRARQLMASTDQMQWERARQYYLEPLLEKFPHGEYASESAAYIDQIDMARSEKRLRLSQRFGRPPSSEGERLYAEAVAFESFGDRLTALEKYDSMVHLLADKPKDRPYLNLALRQKAAIEQRGSTGDRAQFIEDRLQHAEKLVADGKAIEARDIWKSIVKLYGDKREFAALVARADDRLDGQHRNRQPEKGG